jgi:hypothetical protein
MAEEKNAYKHLKPAQIAAALRKSHGLVSVAARMLGCAVQTVYTHISKHEIVAQAMREASDEILDLAEGKLFQAINDGNLQAITFILKTKGRTRGYVEETEIGTKDGKPLVVHFKIVA